MKSYMVATFLLICLLSLQDITAHNVAGNIGGGANSHDYFVNIGDNWGTINGGSSRHRDYRSNGHNYGGGSNIRYKY